MAGNNSIQFLRGTEAQRAGISETSLPGQPIYCTDSNKLYIGNGDTEIRNLKAISSVESSESILYEGEVYNGANKTFTSDDWQASSSRVTLPVLILLTNTGGIQILSEVSDDPDGISNVIYQIPLEIRIANPSSSTPNPLPSVRNFALNYLTSNINYNPEPDFGVGHKELILSDLRVQITVVVNYASTSTSFECTMGYDDVNREWLENISVHSIDKFESINQESGEYNGSIAPGVSIDTSGYEAHAITALNSIEIQSRDIAVGDWIENEWHLNVY